MSLSLNKSQGSRRKNVIWDMKLCNTWINGRFTDRYREKIKELQMNNEEDGYIWYTEKPDEMTIDHPWTTHDGRNGENRTDMNTKKLI